MLREGDDFGADGAGALERREVAAAVEDVELGLRNEAVHGLRLIERSDLVERAPDDEDRHFELRQQVVGDVLAGEHGGECALDDPAVLAGDAQDSRARRRRESDGGLGMSSASSWSSSAAVVGVKRAVSQGA